ncbi:carboxypeptidase-like regulatory domain-containing protein [Candidatus Dojkabacteria bacterium]|jgi:hypothetical protein|nr:carboxypeptidase-like regulatory domain-containing protein [Candidatus Dojkabacteria bacterium]
MSQGLPYVISGTIFDTDGSTSVNGATVRARNETNNEIISTTSDSDGNYIVDCSNFASGYLQTDVVTVYVIYSNLDASGTITIANDEHTKNLTLAVIADSSLINYCTVQDVYDELGLTSSDISAQIVIKKIQRAEARINEKTRTTFTATTVTEYYDYNQYNSFRSAEQMDSIGWTIRSDHWNMNFNDMFRLNHYPVVSITGIWKAGAGANQADSWTALTEQTGSGGDFVYSPDGGWVKFITNIPRFGKRAIKVTYTYGHSTVPKHIERLTILLATSDIIRAKASYATFASAMDISIESLSIRNNSGSSASYLRQLNEEIDRAWGEVGVMSTDIV